jgi:predicted ATPase
MYVTQVTLHNDHYPTDRYYPFNIRLCAHVGADAAETVVFFVGKTSGSPRAGSHHAQVRRASVGSTRRHVAHAKPYETGWGFYRSDVKWEPRTGSCSAPTFNDLTDFLDDVALCARDGWRITRADSQQLSHGEGCCRIPGALFREGLYFLDERRPLCLP